MNKILDCIWKNRDSLNDKHDHTLFLIHRSTYWLPFVFLQFVYFTKQSSVLMTSSPYVRSYTLCPSDLYLSFYLTRNNKKPLHTRLYE